MNPLDKDRNPVIIPTEKPVRRGCPKCGSVNFSGRKVQGVITSTCKDCKNEWSGGLPQEPYDPRLPHPPEDPIPPPVSFTKNDKGMVVEERRAVSTAQEFRKGALIPPGEEDDV